MILRSVLSGLAIVAGACASAPAAADVLEIGPAGEARWIAGPLGNAPAAEPASALSAEAEALAHAAMGEIPQPTVMVPVAYSGAVAELSARYDLSPALIEALVWQESRWRANAVSPVGARGLAQLMPGTARELGVDADEPLANLEGGARYLRAQLDRFGGDIEKALAAYNAGPGRVISAGGIPAIRETQNYVASVMGRLSANARSTK